MFGFTNNEYPNENYLSRKLVNITGKDNFCLKCDLIAGSILNGVR